MRFRVHIGLAILIMLSAIGIAYAQGVFDPTRDVIISGAWRWSSGFGIAAGSGCSVTQATNRTTGVTCNGLSGAITTNSTSLAAEAAASFTVTDSQVAVGDVVLVSQRSGAVGVLTDVDVIASTNGSFTLAVMNNNPAAGTAETGAIIINFLVLKAVSQ